MQKIFKNNIVKLVTWELQRNKTHIIHRLIIIGFDTHSCCYINRLNLILIFLYCSYTW